MKPTIENKTNLAFAVAILVLLLIAAAAGWNAVRFEQTFRQVEHTRRMLDYLGRIDSGVLLMQSSTRGYVLTGSRQLLEPFDEARITIAQSRLQLREFTRDRPAQQSRLDELDARLATALELMHRSLATRGTQGLAAANNIGAFLASQTAVQEVRAVIGAMQEEEHRLLGDRGNRTVASARLTTEAALLGCGLAIAFLVASSVLVHRDFRQRQRTEESLSKSQQMFQRVFDQAPDAIIQVNRAGRIVRANRQAEVLFGWNSGELASQRIEQLLPARFHARHGGHLSAYFAAPRTRAMGAGLELFGRRRDDTEFPLDIMLSPIETDDGLQALAVIRDITERKAAEEKIRTLNLDLQLQNARLEIANKELESFSYSVSHDLRAPLRHIDGFASLLTKHAADALDEKGRRFLTVISDSARRMGRLIDDLLTFSRMGRAQMEPGEIDHDRLVVEVIRESGLDRDLRIEWRINPLPTVRADPAMLRQVWLNLIGNAVKYSSRASPPRVEIGHDPAGPGATEQIFYVRDNGVGFDMKYAAKLFGVFQRLHTEAEFEGTGIGLANVRRVITRHGGRTWAESTLGSGATFYFSLPVEPSPTPRPPGGSTQPFNSM